MPQKLIDGLNWAEFVKYLDRTYFGDCSRFTAVKWNVFNQCMRTNNNAEGYNRKWKSWVNQNHPQLAVVARDFRSMLLHTEIEECHGALPAASASSVRKNDEYMLFCAAAREEILCQTDDFDPMDLLHRLLLIFP